MINDAITIVSEGVMGLTIGCARCHSHKYDPIPSRDFYRFKAIFQGVFDEHDWLTFRNRSLKVDVPQRVKRVEQVNPPLNAEVSRLSAQLETATSELRLDLLRHHYPGQAAADRSETLRALKTTGNNRTQQQNILVEMLQRADALPESEQPPSVLRTRHAVRDLQMQIDKLKRQMEPPLTIRALWDRGQPSPTYILHRGEHTKPRRLVGPGVPSVLTDGRTPFIARPPFPHGTQKTGRRLAFARWLTRPDHPMTARVMVNRVWYHHFGSGLVRTLENFGTQGDRPTHPELLDWLAVKFVENNWSIKELHRLIMNSRTYRQSSRVNEKHLDLDPQNRLLSRMTVRRMDAEALRDSLLFVTGRLRNAAGGPPDPVSVSRDGLVSAVPDVDGRWRRSVYLQYRRTETPTIMEVFDYPEMGPNCLTRNVSTVSLQPLMLMNSKHVHDLAAAFAARVQNILSQKNAPDNANRVEIVHQLAVNRPPSGAERDTCLRALARLQSLQIDEPQTALAVYCHTILNSAAFQYVD